MFVSANRVLVEQESRKGRRACPYRLIFWMTPPSNPADVTRSELSKISPRTRGIGCGCIYCPQLLPDLVEWIVFQDIQCSLHQHGWIKHWRKLRRLQLLLRWTSSWCSWKTHVTSIMLCEGYATNAAFCFSHNNKELGVRQQDHRFFLAGRPPRCVARPSNSNEIKIFWNFGTGGSSFLRIIILPNFQNKSRSQLDDVTLSTY